MANHFPKNIKFYDCPCNDRISGKDQTQIIINHIKNNNTFSKMNSIFKNKFNILSTISSESETNVLSKYTKDKQKIDSKDEEQHCYWLDGDEAELISKGELPLGKKILGEKNIL